MQRLEIIFKDQFLEFLFFQQLSHEFLNLMNLLFPEFHLGRRKLERCEQDKVMGNTVYCKKGAKR